MVTVHFKRLFTRGKLKGLTHDDSISFPSKALALDWVNGIRRNAKAGKLDYRLSSYSIQSREVLRSGPRPNNKKMSRPARHLKIKENLPTKAKAKLLLKEGKSRGRPLTTAQRRLFQLIAHGRRPTRLQGNPPPLGTSRVIVYDQIGGIWARKGQPHACDKKCLAADHWYEHLYSHKKPIIGRPDGKIEI